MISTDTSPARMRTHAAQLLVVDDEPELRGYMETLLTVDGHRVATAVDGEDALRKLQRGLRPDLVFLDLLMPGRDGLETLRLLKEVSPATAVIMLSCVADTPKVVQAMRMGALDYLTKPCAKQELDAAISRSLRRQAPSQQQPMHIEDIGAGRTMISASPAMRKIRDFCYLVAKVDMPVLILGESGTGKEVVARLIHNTSPRAQQPFLKVNCAAVPADLLESELFGYEPGAFTGATHSKPGKFEVCNKGTIFLDEIGEMTPALQAKLLHVLQDGQFSRLGGRSTIKVDVRVLAATNVDIRTAISGKRLREDLYYRLNTFVVTVPPLRDRREEIPYLLKHFMTRFAGEYGTSPLAISDSLLSECLSYRWPGNVRELENFVKRSLVLRDEPFLIAELNNATAHGWIAGTRSTAAGAPLASPNPGHLKAVARSAKQEAEISAIKEALEKTRWNRKRAAAVLNISYKAMLYKLREYEIERSARVA